ncbi:MAG: hypothetical protein U5L74_01550 [Ideonella sp.]|nr:hypothetical protein [Ideonella sp.]
MSKRTTTTPKASPAPVPPARPAVAFQPFQWVRPEQHGPVVNAHGALALIGRAKDVIGGVGTILKMIEQHQLDSEHGADGEPYPQAIDGCTAGELMRLAITASELLDEEIWRYHDAVTEAHQKSD